MNDVRTTILISISKQGIEPPVAIDVDQGRLWNPIFVGVRSNHVWEAVLIVVQRDNVGDAVAIQIHHDGIRLTISIPIDRIGIHDPVPIEIADDDDLWVGLQRIGSLTRLPLAVGGLGCGVASRCSDDASYDQGGDRAGLMLQVFFIAHEWTP